MPDLSCYSLGACTNLGHVMTFSCFITDVWREYVSYDVNVQEETREMDMSVTNTAGMDVICGESMAPSIKGKVLLQWFHLMLDKK